MQEACTGDACSKLLEAGLDCCSIALPHSRVQAALVPLRPIFHQSSALHICGDQLVPTCNQNHPFASTGLRCRGNFVDQARIWITIDMTDLYREVPWLSRAEVNAAFSVQMVIRGRGGGGGGGGGALCSLQARGC